MFLLDTSTPTVKHIADLDLASNGKSDSYLHQRITIRNIENWNLVVEFNTAGGLTLVNHYSSPLYSIVQYV